MEINDPLFATLYQMGNKHEYDIEPLLKPLCLYHDGDIDEEEILQVLQWVPEELRIKIWNMYKKN